MEIEVRGHSGCSIDIVKEKNELLVLKSTQSSKYAERLYKQACKQEDACKIKYQHIRVPAIIKIEKEPDRCFIWMEYVYSKNFVEYFERSGFEQINYFTNAIKILLDTEIKASEIKSIKREIIIDKFKDVSSIIRNNHLLYNDHEVLNILKQSEFIFNLLPKSVELPIGKCHGDLTFSNILFNGNNYYLIDFLDSFIESPLLDMVKIRQDSAYQWSLLMYNGSFDSLRIEIVSHKIDEVLNSYFCQFEWYNKYYNTFQLMNFLRILQYAHDENVILFLKNILKNMIS